jgi:hypothetical protein
MICEMLVEVRWSITARRPQFFVLLGRGNEDDPRGLPCRPDTIPRLGKPIPPNKQRVLQIFLGVISVVTRPYIATLVLHTPIKN